MTHTTMFTCIATSKKDWTSKKFFSIFPGRAHELAIEWLRTH